LRSTDLPVHQIRALIDPGAHPARTERILRDHRTRLERRQRLINDQLRDTTRFIERGLLMPTLTTHLRPSQIKLAVEDTERAAAFTGQRSACATKSSAAPAKRRSTAWSSASTAARAGFFVKDMAGGYRISTGIDAVA